LLQKLLVSHFIILIVVTAMVLTGNHLAAFVAFIIYVLVTAFWLGRPLV
jgi:hypothetical protein